MKRKLISEMNNHELLEYMIGLCREIGMNLSTVTTGNLPHKIGNARHGLISAASKVESVMQNNDKQQLIIEPPSFEESMGETKPSKI